ncbi:peptide chain release factor 2 [Collinsella tanakaei]|uniref:Peptide chain release factor 2 n=1 Tax=Collinsella tanakaei YIT 12063 TaxID=742742 RepID=G1WJF8_9ACTN|nr:peptide chain release factor 2 [Collinsella tanakaei]EGX70482.1 peptide chain release factor 2 [Collinsella tanakaei YIT 12063]
MASANEGAVVSQADLTALAERLSQVEQYLHVDEKRLRVAELESRSTEPSFWDNADAARSVMEELARCREDVKLVETARERLADASAALELADELEGDEAAELVAEASLTASELEASIDQMELSSWFTGEFDHGSAIVTIKPGQGGLEAQDWTFMLFKMYMKYCARRGWKVTINDCPAAEVIGIDRATFTVEGRDAFGMLRAEAGVHRLVRISPTDDKKRRQTTFAGVEVIPVLPDDIEIEVAPDDIRVDVYHASGPGGQGVNTTDSAVRVTHLPTGIVVTCQNERSQIQNKAACMQILKARLYELELEKREEALDQIRGPKHTIGFGNQIRSYVLYPYQMVKDLRSGVETGNVEAVLDDGDLDPFIVGYHRWATGNAEPLSLSEDDLDE